MSPPFNWQFCPYCESGNIEAGEYDVEGNELWFDVRCNACGEGWYEVYKATGRESYDGKELS